MSMKAELPLGLSILFLWYICQAPSHCHIYITLKYVLIFDKAILSYITLFSQGFYDSLLNPFNLHIMSKTDYGFEQKCLLGFSLEFIESTETELRYFVMLSLSLY